MTLKWYATRFAIFLLVLLILGGLFKWMLGPVDDAYITCRYAENLAQGKGIVFNPGETVEGCTAFGMMILLALFSLAGFGNLIYPAQFLGFIAWAAVCTMVWGYLKARSENSTPPFSHAFALAFLASCLSTMAWTWAGMETPIVAALWLGAVLSHLREKNQDKLPILSALLVVSAGLMRPDGILIAVPVALSTLLPWSKKSFIRTSIFSALVLGLFGGYWLWRWSYFGYLLPNTFYAKVGSGSLRLHLYGLFYVAKGMIALVIPLIALWHAPRLFVHRSKVKRETWIFAGTCLIGILYIIYVGGDFFPMQRFLIPYAPFWALLYVNGRALKPAKITAKESSTPPAKRRAAQTWLAAGAAMILVNLVCATPQTQLARHIYLVEITDEWAQLGRIFNKTLPKDAVLAAIPIGALGYTSDRYILDMLGLIDLHIAHKEMTTGRAVIGHEKFDTEYVMSRTPDLFLTWPMKLRPVFSDLVDWNQNHLLSPAQLSVVQWIRQEKNYAPQAVPMGEDQYAIVLTRADLLSNPPYATWTPISIEVSRLLLATPNEMRMLISKIGRRVQKGDWRRAMEHLNPPPVNEKRLF